MKKALIAAVIVVFCGVVAFALFTSAGTADAEVLKNGSKGALVKTVQTKLKNWGYYTGTVDGVYGPKTVAAVKYFQKKNGLTQDGIVGAKTAAAMGVTLTASSSSESSGGSYSSGDSYLLAKCIYAEARGEPYTGQVAVGAVILNRVRSSKFPNSISGVIYQPYAFTCVADGQINLTPDANAKKAAQDALNGWDPTNGCLYYYNPATATSSWIWSRTVMLSIGKHNFAL
ncbi:MAG: spore cortex-lytic enzyme [Clostridia bacterium]|nr:spore cortex-lytic enzyme [Clostridia bacterium]